MNNDAEKFDTLVNFRDLGNYYNQEGKKVKSGLLLRSGELVKLSAHDKAILRDEYKLKSIVDLRTLSETQEKPDDVIEGATYYHIDLFKENSEGAPTLAELQKSRDTLTADEHMIEVYHALIESSVAKKCYKEFLDILLHTEDGAIIWHCFAGKDRTGLASMFVLELLGVSKEVIIEDYLHTNVQRKAENDRILAEMRANNATAEELEHSEISLYVRQDYLEYAYEMILNQYSTVEEYLINELDITQVEIDQLRSKYLEA